MKMTATFEIAAWDEKPFDDDGQVAKLTKASVEKRYAGGIEGTAVTEWVMAYGVDGTADFVGIERIRGSVGGQTGSLVIRHVGTFANGAANADLLVLSAGGALAGATGSGSMVADPSGKITLDLHLP